MDVASIPHSEVADATAPCRVEEIALRSPAEMPCGLAAEWQALADVAAQPNSFAEPWFVAASLAHLAPPGGVRLLVVRRAGRLDGVALFAPSARYGRAPLRHTANWRHPNHFFGPPLIRRGEEAAFWHSVILWLDRAEWAPGFLHVSGLVEGGPVHRALAAMARTTGRACAIVHRTRRPLLESALSAEDYYRRNLNAKRRSDYARRRKRLAELGALATRTLEAEDEIEAWCDDFLALEHAGWKGDAGSALASRPDTAAFFRDAVAGAFAAGRLHFLRLDLDRRPVAMLSTFLAAPGAFGFKCAFDETHGRFSPGMLLQIDNLAMLDRPGIAWTDSCASEDHPVAGLWSEWRNLVRVNIRLRGVSRLISFSGARMLEGGARIAAGLGRRARVRS
jgi:CelD/BcsL family acetyltransferase involved in cellulose biosynthesis